MEMNMRYKSGREKPPHSCGVCGATFTKSFSLKRHIKVHTGTKDYECEICAMAFIQKSDLHRHLFVHNEEKTFVCDTVGCGKAFRTKKNLKIHQNYVHIDTKDMFKCDLCSRTFKHRKTLDGHHKIIHSGLTYVCDICGKVDYHKQLMRIHVRDHLDGNTYYKKYMSKKKAVVEVVECLEVGTGDMFDFEPNKGSFVLAEYQEPVISSEATTKKESDRKFLRSFLPHMSSLSYQQKQEFKQSVRLLVEKVLKLK